MPRLGDPVVVKVVFGFPRPFNTLNPRMWSKSDVFFFFFFAVSITWSADI